MLRAVLYLLNTWLNTPTSRSPKTTSPKLPLEVSRPTALLRVLSLAATMEGQTTSLALRQKKATPSVIFPAKSLEAEPTSGPRGDNQPMSVILADLTSLMLLSATIEQDSDKKGLPTTFLAGLGKTVNERLKKTEQSVEISQDTSGISYDSALVCNPIETKTTSEAQRSMERVMLSANSNGQPAPRPRADLVGPQQSEADCTITDRPLCMTFDSGISSPAASSIHGTAEIERIVTEEHTAVTKELHHRLQHLKAFVETKLHDSSQPKQGATLSEEIRDRFSKLSQASLASSRFENPSASELFMEKALSSSLLVFENTKLSAEVAYLKKKVEILEDVAGTRGFITEACNMPIMETISIGSQTDEVQPLSLDEVDFGMSDFSLSSPETNCLMSTALCRDSDFLQPSGMSTPGMAPSKRQRRKLEVPTQLKVTTSTSYSSINPWADAEDKQQNAGCWKGLCACFYNNPQARHH